MSNTQTGAGGSLSRIQALVDELSDTLGRSVAVDNPSFELLCASAQIGVIDQRRIAAIIDRSPPLEPVPWMLSHGIQTSHVPVRLPANEDFGMLPRVCFPIREEGVLSGYLWLFDEPPITDEDMEATHRTVAQLAHILHGEDAALQYRADTLRALTAQAVSRATSVAAVDQAVNLGLLPEDGNLSVHVMHVQRLADVPGSRQAAVGAKDPQLEFSRQRLERPYLLQYEPRRLIMVARNRSPRDTRAVLASGGRLVRTGGIRVDSAGSAAAESPLELEVALSRADFAATLAALLGHGQDPLAWEETGSWRLLQGRALADTTVAELSEDARLLLKRGAPEHWQTVLAYLDAGRSVSDTSLALSIHRATLHYRLERIREIVGPAALDDGWRAVSLHAALKLHQALQLGPLSG